jgi:putative solute:sodium symporter small subunit
MAVLRLVAIILGLWALVSYVFGILLAPALNNIHLGGYPFGFWWAHQGSMYVFIALIFIYAKLMGQLDRKFDGHEE